MQNEAATWYYWNAYLTGVRTLLSLHNYYLWHFYLKDRSGSCGTTGADPGLSVGGVLGIPRNFVLRPLLTSFPHTTCYTKKKLTNKIVAIINIKSMHRYKTDKS